jgi:hypothetical protein
MKTDKDLHLESFLPEKYDFSNPSYKSDHTPHCRDYSTTEFRDYVCEADCPVGGYQAKSQDLRR